MYGGGLNLVMGQILRQGPAIRLISLLVSAERVRMLAQRGEIEVGDPPSPAIPPTMARVKLDGPPSQARRRLSG